MMYLDYSSCHPKGSKNGIVKGVALRLRRLCSTTEEYLIQSKQFMSSLAARGHDPHVIHHEFKSILNTPRFAVRQHRKSKDMSGSALFITKYNPKGPNFRKIINKNLPLLQSDPVAKQIFPKLPIVYKRCNNLSENILRADPYNIQPIVDISETGTKPCGAKQCDLCDNLVHSNSFKCFATDRVFFIRRKLSCTSRYVIYLISCKRCHRQGVGSTDGIKKRWANYKSHVNVSKDSCHIVKHFNTICRCPENPPSLMTIQLIDSLDNTDNLDIKTLDDLLLQKEKFWIGTIVAMHKGTNSTHDWRRTKRVGGENFSKDHFARK